MIRIIVLKLKKQRPTIRFLTMNLHFCDFYYIFFATKERIDSNFASLEKNLNSMTPFRIILRKIKE